jgi:hypothetical protein
LSWFLPDVNGCRRRSRQDGLNGFHLSGLATRTNLRVELQALAAYFLPREVALILQALAMMVSPPVRKLPLFFFVFIVLNF